ncbi:MAG: metallophosphoesterase, partial [Chloroflexi bacterium]|nr:metallophosphoesterase [Chloroflexota bacterium]
MTKTVLIIGVSRVMRLGQLAALLAVLIEARTALGFSWDETGNLTENPGGSGIAFALVVLLALSEFVRLGRLTSIKSLVWLGYIARFTGLGWAGTGFLALLLTWVIPDFDGDSALPLTLFWIAGGLALMTSLYAFSIGRTRIVVRKYKLDQVHAAGMTGRQADLRIVALSDLHLGEFVNAAHIRRAVEISNRETPDIVLLLGDYVDDDGSLAGELVAELTRLEAELGVFAVLGNHDIRCDDSQQLIAALEKDPTVSLLRNSSAFVEVRPRGDSGPGSTTKTVQIIGIESPGDWWYQESDVFGRDVLDSQLSTETADFILVATHHPEAFRPSAERSVDLVMAGHTHGGQLAVPFTGRALNVGRLVTGYFLGLYELGRTRLVVTAGIGVGIIPARFGVPPEVTVVDVSFQWSAPLNGDDSDV